MSLQARMNLKGEVLGLVKGFEVVTLGPCDLDFIRGTVASVQYETFCKLLPLLMEPFLFVRF